MKLTIEKVRKDIAFAEREVQRLRRWLAETGYPTLRRLEERTTAQGRGPGWEPEGESR